MTTVNISTLKNQLSSVLRKVRRGEEVLVVDRNQPVAKLCAVGRLSAEQDDSSLLHDLANKGIITSPVKSFPSRKWLESHLVRPKKKVRAVRALLREREESP